MEIKTFKIFSLCDDFPEDELYEQLSEHNNSDSYIDYTAMSKEKQVELDYGEDKVANKLIELGAEEGEEVLIHLDY